MQQAYNSLIRISGNWPKSLNALSEKWQKPLITISIFRHFPCNIHVFPLILPSKLTRIDYGNSFQETSDAHFSG